MSRITTLLVTMAGAGLLHMGCGGSDPGVPVSGARGELGTVVAALTHGSVARACWTLSVTNQAGDRVWSVPTCGGELGDDPAGFSYVGVCDASSPEHTVTLVLDELRSPSGAVIPPSEYSNPCAAPGDCVRKVTCEADADVMADFNVVLLLNGEAGFIDTTVDIEEQRCSAKLECFDALLVDPHRPNDPPGSARGKTAVLSVTCETAECSWLYVDDVVVTCSRGSATLDLSAVGAHGGPLPFTQTDTILFYAEAYRFASASLGTHLGVALGLTGESDCRLSFALSVPPGGGRFFDKTTPEIARYPYIRWDIPLSDDRGRQICSSHRLGTPGVEAAYAGPGAGHTKTFARELLSGGPGCAPCGPSAPPCDDHDPCTADTCDASSQQCVAEPLPEGTPCDDGDPATVTTICQRGACQPPACVPDCERAVCGDDGCGGSCGACAAGESCQRGACVCTDPEGCEPPEDCQPGTSIGCDDRDPCNGVEICNLRGRCQPGVPPPCDDGNPCNGLEHCDIAEGCHAGEPLACEDRNPCTDDACDPASGCVYVANRAVCDDGNACTAGEVCEGGECRGGEAAPCDDLNACTDDSCNPALGCLHTPIRGLCDDGDACTANDVCQAGACAGGSTRDCDDGNPCTDDDCHAGEGCRSQPNRAPCDDGNPCTAHDTCGSGACQGGAGTACDDTNPCTDDSCVPGLGCVNLDNRVPCDDGNACTAQDRCEWGACVGIAALDCDDRNVCTDDSCNPALGCVHSDNRAFCDDGDACTIREACDHGACAGGSARDCDDSNPCTDDGCDAASGCQNAPNRAACDDGDTCTRHDTCAEGACVGGAARGCDDGNPCTDDSCDPTGGCVYVDNRVPCDDGNACTSQDRCEWGACLGGGAPDCDDRDPCTDDVCNPALGCIHAPNSAACDDRDGCTTRDACAGGSCVGGPRIDCDDRDDCTADSCAAGVCAHAPVACDDGNECTADSCVRGACVHAPRTGESCSDDRDECTEDVCILDPRRHPVCSHPISGCDDGNECTTDGCDPSAGCVHTPEFGVACADDGNECTVDLCLERVDGSASCEHPPADEDSPCTDEGDLCTLDLCTDGVCEHPPLQAGFCDDANDCTADSCDPTMGCVNTALADGSACAGSAADACTAHACRRGTCVAEPLVCDDREPCTFDTCESEIGCVIQPANGSQCAHTAGWWREHPDDWPVGEVLVGGVSYTKAQAGALMAGSSCADASKCLAKQLIGALLNVLSGAFAAPAEDAIALAQAFLVAHPVGTKPVGDAGDTALVLKDALLGYNSDTAWCQCPAPGGDDCDACVGGDKPGVLVLRYAGATCAESAHHQAPVKTSCSGDATGVSPAYVVVATPGGTSLAESWLAAGEALSVPGPFKTRTIARIYDAPRGKLLQQVSFHTSCSQPLLMGDRFASVTLVAFDGWFGPGDATTCPSAGNTRRP
jgi:hypothetical protein